MITFFPDMYPDELVYSCLSRFYGKSGYLAYRFAAEELFVNPAERPNIEFLNGYTQETSALMTRDISFETLVLKHTMFPYYCRFLSKERREKAFSALLQTDRRYYNFVHIKRSKEESKRYLRYCPLCAEADRNKYGEAYWHRIHQITELRICPLHHCYLYQSDTEISSKTSPVLHTAEEASVNREVVYCTSDIENVLADYVAVVFAAEVDFDSDTTAGRFLHYKLAGTPYVSARGKRRDMALFHADFTQFYSHLEANHFTELWQLQKVLTDDRQNLYEICMMALFLKIPAEELVSMKLPEQSNACIYDEKVRKLHSEGMNYMQISKAIGGGYDTVKRIGEGRYGMAHKVKKCSRKPGVKPRNRKRTDAALLPEIRRAIREMTGDGTKRPVKISVCSVGNYLKLPEKMLDGLPDCKAEIQKHSESQPEFWARELLWAYHMVLKNGQNMSRTQICKYTNMRREDFAACLPYLRKYMPEEIAEMIESL